MNDPLTLTTEHPIEELLFKNSRALIVRELTCLHVHHFEGERDDIKDLLAWAKANGFDRVQFLIMRKACLIAFTETLAECPEWTDMKPVGHLFRIYLET